MLFPGGFTFSNFLIDVFVIFIFALWFWFLIAVFGDLFRRQDISGAAKAVWVVVLIALPYFGILAYLISQGPGMAERQDDRVEQAGEELRGFVGFSAADELEKLERLKNSDRLSAAEYARLRTRAVQ
ncbi:MAG: PLDc N-terminal domain-containing protein [Alphaproteobacteria bacterium]|nr:PLDc N-terminal domain-containing protein [Alphaproteobacteria bacterium]